MGRYGPAVTARGTTTALANERPSFFTLRGHAGDLFRSAVTAVVVVHIVMFSYVIVAYFEDVGDAKTADADARKRQ